MCCLLIERRKIYPIYPTLSRPFLRFFAKAGQPRRKIDTESIKNEDRTETIGAVCMNIKVLIEKGEDGYFVASVPALKGCWSQGKTREEALRNIREAIDLYLEPEPFDFERDGNSELVELAI